MNKNYQIVIVVDRVPLEPYFCFDAFQKSLEGEHITVLGWGTGEYKNLSDRPRMMHRAFKAGAFTKPNIIYCDAWDLFFVDKPEVLFEKHNALGGDLTISTERNCFPDDLKKVFDAHAEARGETSSYKYLNCGFFIGKTDALYAVLNSMDAENTPTDYWDEEKGAMHHYNEQVLFQKEYFKQTVNIKLDYKQDLVWCMQDVTQNDVELAGRKICNVETDVYPSVIHFNGGSKTAGLREPILKHFNYL